MGTPVVLQPVQKSLLRFLTIIEVFLREMLYDSLLTQKVLPSVENECGIIS